MVKLYVFILIIQILFSQSLEKRPLTIGETVSFQSLILKEKRQLNIYLPENYSQKTDSKFNVIFVLDGSIDEDFIHTVGLVQFASFPWVKMLANTIVVGIANVNRRRDFTTSLIDSTDEEIVQQFPSAGGADKFITFLEKEVIPYIDKNFNVTDHKTIIGQSLGGLMATEILYKKPQLFSTYFIVSPSLWWNDQELLKRKPNFIEPSFKKPISVFVTVGKEGDIMESTAKKLYSIVSSSRNSTIKSSFHFFEDQDHGNILHLAIYKGFEIFKTHHE